VLDSTYKTNRHNLYLLNIVGVTATNSSFIIRQAFLSYKGQEDYSWVLECLKDIYSEASLEISKCIATDKAGGLILTVIQVFPDVPYILYI
jgi:hypothetical protein